jgi:predicted HTH domain antitoxin
MTAITIEFPESTLSALRRAPEQLEGEVRVAAAIHWYQQARISMERAAECAGMNRAEFLEELARRKVDVFVVDEADLRSELQRG